MRLRPLLWATLIFFLASSLSAQGVVVEAVAVASAPEKAGAREGDVFHTWTRLANPLVNPEPASGTLQSPFDWQWMEIEQARREASSSCAESGRVSHSSSRCRSGSGTPRCGLCCLLSSKTSTAVARSWSTRRRSRRVWRGGSRWRSVSETAGIGACALDMAAIGLAWDGATGLKQAEAAYEAALRESRDPLSRIAILEAMGESFVDQERFEEAEASYRSAFALGDATWGESLGSRTATGC